MAGDWAKLGETHPSSFLSWIKGIFFLQVEKAGATALFEDGKGDNVGIVVTPVRLNSLPEFGTPQFVLDKLIQAEKRKVCY